MTEKPAPQTTVEIVRAALRKAVDVYQETHGVSPNDLDAAHDQPRVAAAIATFVRALPYATITFQGPGGEREVVRGGNLATALEEMAS